MTYETIVRRPDPRRPDAWCREGVAHDHGACGSLWDSTDQRDLAEAARWADSQAEMRPPAVEAFRHAFLLAGGPIGAQDDAIRAGLDAALRESGTAAALAEMAELRALLEMQWQRMTEATARWRAEDPEARALVMPDLGDLLRWLMDDADRARGTPTRPGPS